MEGAQIEVGGQAEVDAKLARVRGYLGRSGLAGVLLTRQDNFAWLTAGRDNHVVAGSDVGVASLLVTHDGAYALADRIESGRMRDEEIGEQRWEWRSYDWYRPGVVLIATDERVDRYRHPIPTEKKLRDYGMLVLGGSKWGLQVSITRFVSFHPLGDELKRKWRDVSTIAAYFTRATRPGERWSEIFRGATELYRELGWGEEWELHHQGGPTGYRGREFTANFDSPGTVAAVQAAAWNPSITGTKS
jgi:Xaa-Pro aminopeptidase